MTLVIKGKLSIRINGINHDLKQGQAVFINKSILHGVTHLSREGKYISFNFPEKLLAFYADSAMEQNYVLPYTNSSLSSLDIKGETDWEKQILELLWSIKDMEANKSWGWQYDISIKTVQLWLILITNLSLTPDDSALQTRHQQERMQLMLSFIHQNYAEPVTLQDIAGVAHLSLSECTRSFKKNIYMTPYNYLVKYRIQKSCELLESTAYSISEISRRVGFNHAAHFIHTFKKLQAHTPKEFRKLRDAGSARNFNR